MVFYVDPNRLGLSRRTGRKLPAAVRSQMEAAFATDFSGVRVHVGPQAERLGTIAFAVGADIYFAPGHYDPTTDVGQLLLGHELAHVAQQHSRNVPRQCSSTRVALVQDRQLEAEADQMAIMAALRQPVLSPRTAWPRTSWRLPRNSLIIQPWTPTPAAQAHLPGALSNTAYESYEILSSQTGVESDTGKFSGDHHGTNWLRSCTNSLICYYNGKEIGKLRTVTDGSERVKPLVQMHLVNSFLHPEANNWETNWFWGSHDLNKQHNIHEELAKKCHPVEDQKKPEGERKGSLLLQYETSVVAAKRPKASTLPEFKKQLIDKIKSMRKAASNYFLLDTQSDPVSSSITIGEPAMDVEAFYGFWTTAIEQTAYAKVKVKYRYLTTNGWEGDYDKFADYDDTYLIDIIEGGTKKRQVGSVWQELFPLASANPSKRTKRI